jgi:hypothetical protein
MVCRQNRYAGIAGNPRREPVRDAFRHMGEFGESDALHRLRALDFEGYVIGEFTGGFLESLVEGGHVRGEYTKDG